MRNHAYKKAYKKFLLKLRSQIFSCVFSRSFIVSGCFAFSSVIHFELIFFAYSVKYGLNFLFFFFVFGYPFVSALFGTKNLSFAH